ncbi:MAG: glycoside hydrolase family 3 N-terminal domain-containing protein [Clostridiales bacterium]|nr:glycoside hydrolase family 3 N-terminal domain-containing protein [Clostridiales bacterium]
MGERFRAEKYRDKSLKLLSRMTLKEKIGQMSLFGSLKETKMEYLREGLVGGFLNVYGAAKVNELQKVAFEQTRLGIPLLIGDDVIHGFRTIFPIPLATSCSWDLDKIKYSESIAAREASASGINWIYAPMVDISRDPRWGRIAEGAGEDPYLGCKIARARVQGFQSINPETNYPYVAACPKHFAAYGLSEGGRDYDGADISEHTLNSVYMPPYKAAVDAGAMSIMSSFNTINGEPASGSKKFLTDILKNEYGFEGFVVSDWESIMELIYHRVAKDRKDAARLGVKAGNDMDMHSGVYMENLEQLVNEDPELLNCINESVTRILCVKFALGLFDNPYKNTENENIQLCDEFRNAARDMARRSMVLLKNEGHILPLKKTGGKILVTGPLADAARDMIGMWGCKGNEHDAVTLLQALKNTGDNTIEYIKGCDFENGCSCDFEKAKNMARDCDVIIYACGEPESWTGEIHCRSDISLPKIQNQYLDVLKSTGKPVVAVLMTGRPLACEFLDQNADAILLAWHGGIEAGNACSDIIFGDYAPAGKITATFPRSTGQIPVFYSRLSSGRPYEMFKRYIDVDVTPLYPFGYGLTYADIEYSNIKIENPYIKKGDILSVKADVTNKSNITSEEVVQAYFMDVVSSIATPVRRLCDFVKTEIPANTTKTISFKIPAERFAFLDRQSKPVLEKGEFRLFIGTDSNCKLKASFYVTE